MKFTVKMNRKEYTLTENDRIMFNGAIYILITQKVCRGFSHGYPSYALEMLKEHYKDREKVEKLIALGDISVLDEEVDIPNGVEHSFEKPHEGITVA